MGTGEENCMGKLPVCTEVNIRLTDSAKDHGLTTIATKDGHERRVPLGKRIRFCVPMNKVIF